MINAVTVVRSDATEIQKEGESTVLPVDVA